MRGDDLIPSSWARFDRASAPTPLDIVTIKETATERYEVWQWRDETSLVMVRGGASFVLDIPSAVCDVAMTAPTWIEPVAAMDRASLDRIDRATSGADESAHAARAEAARVGRVHDFCNDNFIPYRDVANY